jgi:hypothetical protein
MRNSAARHRQNETRFRCGQKLYICKVVATMHEQNNKATEYRSETNITSKRQAFKTTQGFTVSSNAIQP